MGVKILFTHPHFIILLQTYIILDIFYYNGMFCLVSCSILFTTTLQTIVRYYVTE
jgi:hypothetical protein